MSRPILNLTGCRFGRLVVLEIEKPIRDTKRLRWVCRCDCGAVKTVSRQHLRQGHTQSCGCHRRDWGATLSKTHGLATSRLYRIWSGMRQRCLNPRATNAHRYLGRGITVCPEWSSFEKFLEWSRASGYEPHLTLDRADNNGPYSPENCRWATTSQQARNRRNTRKYSLHGKSKLIQEWAAEFEISAETVKSRLRMGWDILSALSSPPQRDKTGGRTRNA